MSAARIAALQLRLQSVQRELNGVLSRAQHHKEQGEQLKAEAAGQESATNALSLRNASILHFTKVDHFKATARELSRQEAEIERELSSAQFFDRIAPSQFAAMDETAGVES